MELAQLLAEIDRKKAILDSRRPLPAGTVQSIRQASVWRGRNTATPWRGTR